MDRETEAVLVGIVFGLANCRGLERDEVAELFSQIEAKGGAAGCRITDAVVVDLPGGDPRDPDR